MVTEVRATGRSGPRFRARFTKWSIIMVFIVVAGAIVWRDRAFILTEAAVLWTVSDNVAPADAVAVFGGGVETRPFAAARYYREGLVPKVLISNLRNQPATYSETEANRKVVVSEGVPQSAVQLFGADPSNTYQEAVALRVWALHNHASSLIVPTEYFSSRRVRWTLRHVFAGTGIHVLVPALDSPDYSLSGWWHDEKGLVDFQNEILKYIYYRIKY